MWICFNNAFVSVVADKNEPGKLMVRARQRAHLVAVFGKGRKVVETKNADYRWRVLATRSEVAALVAKSVTDIGYTNFKNSVTDDPLHDMYALWWSDHHRLQTAGWATSNGKGKAEAKKGKGLAGLAQAATHFEGLDAGGGMFDDHGEAYDESMFGSAVQKALGKMEGKG